MSRLKGQKKNPGRRPRGRHPLDPLPASPGKGNARALCSRSCHYWHELSVRVSSSVSAFNAVGPECVKGNLCCRHHGTIPDGPCNTYRSVKKRSERLRHFPVSSGSNEEEVFRTASQIPALTRQHIGFRGHKLFWNCAAELIINWPQPKNEIEENLMKAAELWDKGGL
jgi:hypothetical protein